MVKIEKKYPLVLEAFFQGALIIILFSSISLLHEARAFAGEGNPLRISVAPAADTGSCLVSLKKNIPSFSLIDIFYRKNLSFGADTIFGFVGASQVPEVAMQSCVQSVFPARYADHYDRGIFLPANFSSERPWRSCYTGSLQAAFQRIEAGDHKYLAGLEIEEIQKKGRVISFVAKSATGFEQIYDLSPCVFKKNDVFRFTTCEFTFIDAPRQNDDQHIAVDRLWRKAGEAARVIDCKNKKLKRVTNAWSQPIPIADLKVLRAMNCAGDTLVTLGASSGSVKLGGSLHPLQNWSAMISLPLIQSRYQQELCDASLLQFSVPGEVEGQIANLGGSWCPWGMEIQSLKCTNGVQITNRQIEPWIPLEMTEKITKYCQEDP